MLAATASPTWVPASSPRGLMPSPRSVDIEITPRCNLRCSYCYFFNSPGESYLELPASEWLAFFDELGAQRVMSVCLAGGEPFIRKDLPDLLAGIVRNRMRFSLLSNGGLIDDGIAAYIAATGRCDQVQISVDGSHAATHDACRGKGSFDAAIRGIRILQRHRIPVMVRMTVHRHNVDDIEATAEFLLATLGLPRFGTNAASYLGTCRIRQDEVALTLDERMRAMRAMLAVERKFPGRIVAQAGPLADAHAWRRMEAARQAEAPPFAMGGRLTACGCVFARMGVRSDGSMIPCTLLPHLVMGRINRDTLRDVWERAAAMTAMRNRQERPLQDAAFCTGCPYQPYCTGNCPALAYTLTGDVHAPSPDACLRSFLAEGGSIP